MTSLLKRMGIRLLVLLLGVRGFGIMIRQFVVVLGRLFGRRGGSRLIEGCCKFLPVLVGIVVLWSTKRRSFWTGLIDGKTLQLSQTKPMVHRCMDDKCS